MLIKYHERPIDRQVPIGSGYDETTTAEAIVSNYDLTGKTAIVTGANSGIGLEVTRALVSRGARVIAPVRSVDAAKETFGPLNSAVEAAPLDLMDFPQIERFTEEINNTLDRVDLLINCAGFYKGNGGRFTKYGFEPHFHLYLALFVLTLRLRPLLRAAPNAREVVCASAGHLQAPMRWEDLNFKQGLWDFHLAYGVSNLAKILGALERQKRWKEDGTEIFSVHPGWVPNTNITRFTTKAELVRMGLANLDGSLKNGIEDGAKSNSQGAAPVLFAALSPLLAGKGGLYVDRNCDLAKPVWNGAEDYKGVAPYALDLDNAERLWTVSVDMVKDLIPLEEFL